jgi:O-antigen ligase
VVILAALTMPLLLAVARLPRRVILAITAVALLLPAGALLVYLAWCGVAGLDPMLPLREVTVSDRTPIWEFVIGEIAKRPWLGAGYSSFWAIDPALQPSLKSGPSLGIFSMINEGHEGYLDLLVTGGIIGLAGGLFILLRAIVLAGRAVVSTRPPDQAWRDGDMARPTAIFHLAFLLGLVIHNFTESNLFTNSGLLAVALMLCLLDLEKWRLARRPAPLRRR